MRSALHVACNSFASQLSSSNTRHSHFSRRPAQSNAPVARSVSSHSVSLNAFSSDDIACSRRVSSRVIASAMPGAVVAGRRRHGAAAPGVSIHFRFTFAWSCGAADASSWPLMPCFQTRQVGCRWSRASVRAGVWQTHVGTGTSARTSCYFEFAASWLLLWRDSGWRTSTGACSANAYEFAQLSRAATSSQRVVRPVQTCRFGWSRVDPLVLARHLHRGTLPSPLHPFAATSQEQVCGLELLNSRITVMP